MENTASVVNDILQELLVQAAEQPIQAPDFNTTVRYMNRYMAQLQITVPLGYTKVKNPDDPITIADGAIEGLIFNTAIRLANSYDIPVSGSLQKSARESLNTMRKIARFKEKTKHPSTLPIGTGNEYFTRSDRFYPGEQDSILTEQDGNILLEDQTNGEQSQN